jgi:hypothetical protein
MYRLRVMADMSTGSSLIKLMLSLICIGLVATGCSYSLALEEPHLEKVQAMLAQGEQNGYPAADRYLRKLDMQTQHALATKMLRSDNPLEVYLGGSLLVRQKHYDEVAPVMVRLVLEEGTAGHDLRSRMESDWRHDADPETWPNMVTRVGHTLIVNMGSYQPESRNKAEQFLAGALHLEANKPYSQEDAITAVLKLSRGLKQENS